MTAIVLAVGALAGVLTYAILRECRRVELERRRREWLAANPLTAQMQQMARALEDCAATIGRRFLPAVREAAEAMGRIDWTPLRGAANRVDITLRADTTQYQAALTRAREAARHLDEETR